MQKDQGKRIRDKNGAVRGERFLFSFSLYIFPFFAACLLFARTLNFPLMYDTLLHTQLADGQTVWSVFVPNEQFGFYRPLVFLPIVVFQNVLGRYPIALFHLLNVVTHGLNAALVARLVWKLSGAKWQSLAAGLLFATFPFAYQALAIYGNNPYLTATFFILLGLNLTSRRDEGRGERHPQQREDDDPAPYILRNEWIGLPAVFLIGVLVHETAVLLVPFVLFLSWIGSEDRAVLSVLRKHWPLLVTCILYLAIYPFLPRGGGPVLDFGGNDLTPKILLFLQTAAWPTVLGLFQVFDGRLAILLGFALFVGWVVYSHFVARSTTLLLGIVWVLLATGLIGVTLPTYYIEDGARLLYPAGVGVALIWSALLVSRDLTGFKNLSGLLGVWFVIGLIAVGGAFNMRMIGLYEMGSRPYRALNQVVQESSPEAVMLVNMPQWVAWPEQVFPAGTEFAPVMGSHLFALELIRANTGQTPEIIVLDMPEALAQTDYTYGVYKVGSVAEYTAAGDKTIQTVATEYAESGPVGRWRGSIRPAASVLNTWSAGGLNFSTTTACTGPDGSVLFETIIEPDGPIGETQSLFVQALSGTGQLVAQNDGPPLTISPGRLRLNDRVQVVDRRILESEEKGAFVLAGVYDFMTGERAETVSADGGLVENNAFKLNVSSSCATSE